MKYEDVLRKLTTDAVSILNYCKKDSNGIIANQDEKIKKCLLENRYIDLQGSILSISSTIQTPNNTNIINGTIQKANNNGQIKIGSESNLTNIIFKQSKPDMGNLSLLYIPKANNIIIDKCKFLESSIEIDSNAEHDTIRIINSYFSSSLTKEVSTENINENIINTHIKAKMVDGKGRIINMQILNNRINTGKNLVIANNLNNITIRDNTIYGIDELSDENSLNLIHLIDINSILITNNTIKKYKTKNKLIYMNKSRGTVNHNIIKDNKAGMAVGASECEYLDICNNEISRSIYNLYIDKGIATYKGQNYIISNNKVTDCIAEGISIQMGNQDSVISSNVLYNNNVNSTSWNPSMIIDNCTRVSVTGNTIYVSGEPSNIKPAFRFTNNNSCTSYGNNINSYIENISNTNCKCDLTNNSWVQ